MVADGQLLADAAGRYTTVPGTDEATTQPPVTAVTGVTDPLFAQLAAGPSTVTPQ
jgi:hypothetical protein